MRFDERIRLDRLQPERHLGDTRRGHDSPSTVIVGSKADDVIVGRRVHLRPALIENAAATACVP